MKRFAIIVAGGFGNRMQSDTPKQFIEICGKPILMHTIYRFYEFDNSIEIIIVLPQDMIKTWNELCNKYNFNLSHIITAGGKNRFHSSYNGLQKINEAGLVAIHDGVRPLISSATLERCFKTAKEKGNSVPCISLNDSIRKLENNENFPVNRNEFCAIQTPQVFRVDQIKKAYNQPYNEKFTDDAMVLENSGYKINLVEGNIENIKITTNTDLIFAEGLLKNIYS